MEARRRGSERQRAAGQKCHDAAFHAAPGSATLGNVVIRFAGDSGDGMQLTGDRFT